MERPRARIKSPEDEYDYELTQLQTDLLEFGRELCSLKENNRLTFVDFILQGDDNEMLAELESGPMSEFLAGQREQLAIPSDGSYYPKLDLSKNKAKFYGMVLRVFGWKSDKMRYTNLYTRKDSDPYEWKEYEREEDWTYEFSLGMSYACDKEVFSESLAMTVGSARPDNLRINSQVFAHAYAETGYEGHGGHGASDPTDEQVVWLADFIAKHLGDRPITVEEYQRSQLNKLSQRVEELGGEGLVEKLVKYTWEAQALGVIKAPRYQVGDKKGSIANLLMADSSKLNEIGIEGLREVVNEQKHNYKERKRYRIEHPEMFKGL